MVKPILFNTDMVRAILDDRKTVTRRVMKSEIGINQEINKNFNGKFELYDISPRCGIPKGIFLNPPYQPGDYMYVRETFSYDIEEETYLYKASPETYSHIGTQDDVRWYPSIHMPREAARIWLKVVDVRVEKLREITFDGIANEGINPKYFENENGVSPKDFVEFFISLWDFHLKKKDLPLYGWDVNPWVWVIEFERTVKPE